MDTFHILRLDAAHLGDVFHADSQFLITRRLLPLADETGLSYRIVPCPPRAKSYEPEEIDISSYLDDPDRAIYLAYAQDQLAGQIILRKYWNAYGYIDDIAVSPAFRRQGLGRWLLQTAQSWAQARRLPGLMLETQDVNVAACLLYQSCGFVLGGFDRFLYKALDPSTDEVALYWYWTSPGPV